MKKYLFIFAILCFSSTSYALLSPLGQSIEEIKAVISSPELHHYLKESETIQEIRRLEDTYVIITNKSRLSVMIHYLPTKKVGPREFTLDFSRPVPLNQ